jgi:hypothetical protein
MTEQFNHRLPVDGRAARRVANIARANAALRKHFRRLARRMVEAVYATAKVEAGEEVFGYGIDHRGPWARVGDATARGKTLEAALEAALTKHKETSGGASGD